MSIISQLKLIKPINKSFLLEVELEVVGQINNGGAETQWATVLGEEGREWQVRKAEKKKSTVSFGHLHVAPMTAFCCSRITAIAMAQPTVSQLTTNI